MQFAVYILKGMLNYVKIKLTKSLKGNKHKMGFLEIITYIGGAIFAIVLLWAAIADIIAWCKRAKRKWESNQAQKYKSSFVSKTITLNTFKESEAEKSTPSIPNQIIPVVEPIKTTLVKKHPKCIVVTVNFSYSVYKTYNYLASEMVDVGKQVWVWASGEKKVANVVRCKEYQEHEELPYPYDFMASIISVVKEVPLKVTSIESNDIIKNQEREPFAQLDTLVSNQTKVAEKTTFSTPTQSVSIKEPVKTNLETPRRKYLHPKCFVVGVKFFPRSKIYYYLASHMVEVGEEVRVWAGKEMKQLKVLSCKFYQEDEHLPFPYGYMSSIVSIIHSAPKVISSSDKTTNHYKSIYRDTTSYMFGNDNFDDRDGYCGYNSYDKDEENHDNYEPDFDEYDEEIDNGYFETDYYYISRPEKDYTPETHISIETLRERDFHNIDRRSTIEDGWYDEDLDILECEHQDMLDYMEYIREHDDQYDY